MKEFNIEVGHTLELVSLCIRVKAVNKQQAKKLIFNKGFNAGTTLSTIYKSKPLKNAFEVNFKDIMEVKNGR